MKVQYTCDVCDRMKDTMAEVAECENSHVILTPKWYWFIPLVAWFLMPYYLFTIKGAIIQLRKEYPNAHPVKKVFLDLIQEFIVVGGIGFSPIILFLLLMLYFQ